jgi:hypothetical protein
MSTKIHALLADLADAIEKLESENKQLKLALDAAGSDSTKQNTLPGGEGDFLEWAIEHMEQHKWMEAAKVVVKHYGINFMIKSDSSFMKLKEQMYLHFEMPEAPSRSDRSQAAEELRERRKAIRAMVYTYIDRMGDYYLRSIGK